MPEYEFTVALSLRYSSWRRIAFRSRRFAAMFGIRVSEKTHEQSCTHGNSPRLSQAIEYSPKTWGKVGE